MRYALGDAPDLSGFDVLIHAAHDFSESTDNVAASQVLLESARRAGVRQIVFISSLAAFEGCVSRYGRTKIDIEALVDHMGGVSLRPGTIWGGAGKGLLGSLARLANTLPILPALSGGHLALRLVHVDDVCQTVVDALGAHPQASGVVTIAHEQTWTLTALLRALARQNARNPLLIPVPAALVYRVLQVFEAARVPLPLRSDSLRSLMNANPNPDLQLPSWVTVRPRAFSA